MSPASRSKTKDKKSGKELPKAASKPTGSAPAGSIPASAYNPLSGTFHTLEPPVSASSPLNSNGRFKNIDDTDAQSGVPLSSGVEYDSVSNNGSWSGESEDHKDKKSNPTVRQETIPGADIDKREKIRQKNEKKHQRQKEKRAQELHERCSGYLMSRKLEALAQQLVAMGFSQERATIALILNEGKIEESVAWLFEGGEEAADSGNQNIGGQNLKLDISEELARISDLEAQYKCSKQEVERAVVACEGDLEKAAESLRELKLDPPSAPPRPEETGDPPTTISSKFPGNTSQILRPQVKPIPSSIQQRKEEKDFNYTKAAITVGTSTDQSVGKNIPQPMKRSQPKMEWGSYEQITTAEKRWPNAGASQMAYPLASSPTQLSSPPIKNETRYLTVGTEYGGLQSGPLREPSTAAQGRHPSFHIKQASSTGISSSPPAGLYSTNGIEIMKSSGGYLPQIRSSTGFKVNDVTLNQMYPQVQYHHQQQQQFVPGNRHGDFVEATHPNSSWSRMGASSSIAAASSLGLFSGSNSTGQSGASSPVDWNIGNAMPHLDYSSIDWSVNRGGASSARPVGLLQGVNSYMQKNGHLYESNASGVESQAFMPSNYSRVSIAGLQKGVGSETSANGSREWTSPFEGKDIFSFPRQFVFSPP